MQYKSPDGGITRRNANHFVKRVVRFEVDGEERAIEINKNLLPMEATEEEIVSFIEGNADMTSVVNAQMKLMQKTIDTLLIDSLMKEDGQYV